MRAPEVGGFANIDAFEPGFSAGMEPFSGALPWPPSTSVGIDEDTLKELLDMDTFADREAAFPPPVDDGFVNAYMEELRGRRRMSMNDPLVGSARDVGPSTAISWNPQDLSLVSQSVHDIEKHPTFPPPSMSGLEFPSGEMNLEAFPFDATATIESTTPKGGAEGRKKRLRTPQQQELNKLAQQRYRERRKAKHSTLEAEVNMLRQQLDGLRQVEAKNVELARRNTFLEKLVSMQQEEIALLKSQLLLPLKKCDTESCESQSRPKQPEELTQDLETHARALKQFLDSNGIHRGDTLISDQSRQLIGRIVGAVCEATVSLSLRATPKVGELVDKDAHSVKEHSMDELRPCIEALHLTKEQKATLLHMRADHLTRMRGLYVDRQKLNMQAMSLMLPHPLQAKGGEFDPTVDGKMNCMGRSGFRNCSQGEEMLKAVLDEIKDNLQKEQRSYFELQVALLQSILNPVQAAMIIVHWHPDLVDALAFSNTLASMQGVTSIDL